MKLRLCYMHSTMRFMFASLNQILRLDACDQGCRENAICNWLMCFKEGLYEIANPEKKEEKRLSVPSPTVDCQFLSWVIILNLFALIKSHLT